MRKILLILLVLALVLLVACSETVNQENVKIGVTLPLTGEAVSLGDDIKAGIELGVKEVNEAGGIRSKQLEVVYEDDKCSNQGATTLTKLVNVDNVAGIVGPLCSAAGGPGLPVVQKSSTPAIIFASAPHLTKIGDYIFRVYPSDAFGGEFAAEYLYNELGKKRAAVVYVKNDWGQGLHDTFIPRFKELGGEVVFDDSLRQDDNDAKTLITKLKSAAPDVVFAPLYPAVNIVFLKQSKEAGVSALIFGGDASDTSEVIESEVSEDLTFFVASIVDTEQFKANLKKVTGKESKGFAPLGYDAIKIFAEVMNKVGTDKKAVRDELAKIKYAGISSPVIEFDENGDLKSAKYKVKLVKNKKAEVIFRSSD